MPGFAEIYERIKLATNSRTQVELAEVLDIRQSSISDAKRRNSVPGDWFMKLFEKFGLNPDWLKQGVGPMYLRTEQGYVPETSAEEGGWNIPFIGFVHGTETMAREKRLEDNSWNIMYVAAYIKYFEDTWIDVFPEISSRPDILGTLYNIGHEKTSPNSNPGSNKFGDDVEYFYDLMGEALK